MQATTEPPRTRARLPRPNRDRERALDCVATLARDSLRREILKTLRDFLDRVGEPWWAEWVQIAMEDGRYPDSRQGAEPGSLDSLVLGIDRIDRVPPHLLPWANAVLDCLRCLVRRMDDDEKWAARHDGDRSLPGDSRIEGRCRDCIRATCENAGADAVRVAVGRSVERACRDGRFDHLLVLGRLERDFDEAPADLTATP